MGLPREVSVAEKQRSDLWLGVAVMTVIGIALGLRFMPTAIRLSRQGVVVRRAGATRVANNANRDPRNIAPAATVTVSSEAATRAQNTEGVADGQPDSNEWVAADSVGAWVTLTWDRPALIDEIVLYDRPDRSSNVRSGALSFDDGSVIIVHALPVEGAPEHIKFPPKTVHSVTFRPLTQDLPPGVD
ncbi:MAG: hypothetical protein ABI806_07925, partial [Candidatus Solibacter sp.]